ncbi:MAG: methylamine utilization protein [Gammaproteobacteria bacterium]|nr:methylamine utilization protein [Gammaproteobacteria bacterium]MCL5256027.1 methylamine utilization protein [Gammaproteobacteria bacterium]
MKKLTAAAFVLALFLVSEPVSALTALANPPENQKYSSQLQLLDANNDPLVGAVLFDTSPSAENTVQVEHIMDQVQRQFVPAVLMIQAGDTVKFPNSDSIRHHVFSFSTARSFDLELYGNSTAPTIDFPNAGYIVVGCNIHDDMIGHIIVSSSGRFYESDHEGSIDLSMLEGFAGWYLWHPWMAAAGLAPIALTEVGLTEPFRIAIEAPPAREESELESRFRRRLQRGH